MGICGLGVWRLYLKSSCASVRGRKPKYHAAISILLRRCHSPGPPERLSTIVHREPDQMKTNRDTAFTLIELIISLAVIAALLSALVLSFIKRLDRLASDKEMTALRAIGTAFKESVRRARYVPDETGWAAIVAAHLGWQTNDVTSSDRNSARIFLIDPNMQIRTNSGTGPLLPYTQPITGSMVTQNGNIVRPINPRFMVISSIGR